MPHIFHYCAKHCSKKADLTLCNRKTNNSHTTRKKNSVNEKRCSYIQNVRKFLKANYLWQLTLYFKVALNVIELRNPFPRTFANAFLQIDFQRIVCVLRPNILFQRRNASNIRWRAFREFDYWTTCRTSLQMCVCQGTAVARNDNSVTHLNPISDADIPHAEYSSSRVYSRLCSVFFCALYLSFFRRRSVRREEPHGHYFWETFNSTEIIKLKIFLQLNLMVLTIFQNYTNVNLRQYVQKRIHKWDRILGYKDMIIKIKIFDIWFFFI